MFTLLVLILNTYFLYIAIPLVYKAGKNYGKK